MRAAFRPEAAKGVRETYECHIGDEVFHFRVENGSAEVAQGSAPSPNLIIRADFKSLHAVVSRQVYPTEAIDSGRVEIQGDPAALLRCIDIFGFTEAEDASTS
jgi:putative sterol carrier protein